MLNPACYSHPKGSGNPFWMSLRYIPISLNKNNKRKGNVYGI